MSHGVVRHTPRIFILPGWQGSSLNHWQTRWERLHGLQRIEQDNWDWPQRSDWVCRLEETLLADPGVSQDCPAILVAHSLGCHLVAAWAAQTQHTHLVRAALLVAPPDLEGLAQLLPGGEFPPQLSTWLPVIRQPLAFSGLVVASTDDIYSSAQRAACLAADWGGQWLQLGAYGHINSESGLGDWPEGWAMLQQLMRTPASTRRVTT